MEDGLGVYLYGAPPLRGTECLNPCFSGGWSRSAKAVARGGGWSDRLNPCFSGGWSRRQYGLSCCFLLHSLNPCFSGGWSRRYLRRAWGRPFYMGLNPCFSGGWSRSSELQMPSLLPIVGVLILVLVEDGLGDLLKLQVKSNGEWS